MLQIENHNIYFIILIEKTSISIYMVQIERNQRKGNIAAWHLGYFLAKENISVQYKSLYPAIIANSR